jgi:AraC-like DNA-binding protein
LGLVTKPKPPKAQENGFELKPEGCLLEQVIELDSEMGLAYERSCEFYKDFHAHDRLMLVIPRGACVMEVRIQKSKATHRIDADTVFLLPAGLKHDDEGVSSIYDTLALYPSEALIREVAKELQITPKEIVTLQSTCHQVKRSLWLDQLIQEYFFERVVSRNLSSESARFFEKRILVEILRLVFQKGKSEVAFRSSPSASDEVTTKALKVIEADLFGDLDLDGIAKRAGASVSTLLRKFKKDMGRTPYEYIKNRRLDEAMRLLKNSGEPVGQVALLIGYENFGAFTDAFKAKFGKPPSAFRPS